MTEAIDVPKLVEAILIDHGPLHEDAITQRLRAAGVPDPDTAVRAGLDEIEWPTGQLADDRWVWVPTVLAGRVFTHRIGADELAHDILEVTPDLDPITRLCDHPQFQQLADGSPVSIALADYDDELLDERGIPEEAVPEGGVLLLAPGTLSRLNATEGDLIAMRLAAQGLVIERVTTYSDSDVGAQLAATLNNEPVPVDTAVWTVCAEDAAAFSEPTAPLSELADTHDMAREGELLAPAGFDFASWRFDLRCELMALRHDLDSDDALTLCVLIDVCEKMSLLLTFADEPLEEDVSVDAEADNTVGLGELVAEFGAALADPLLAELLLRETVGNGRVGATALGLFAEAMEPKVPRSSRVAFRWLRAVALERIGAVDEAERELLAAESMDTDWPLTLLDLARFAADRGDAERGLALLRRAEATPDHPLIDLLERYRPEPRRDVGRNEPCWCGSGRKYKKCHLGNEQQPLAERAAWLYIKATQHVLLTDWEVLLADVNYERARYDDDPTAVRKDPLPMDAVLCEGGAFADFLEHRGFLLPDDERQLAEQWSAVQRSVFEVEQVQRGQHVTVRDVRTGDIHEVRERIGSRELKPGQLVCARVLPAGDTKQFWGGLEPVALHERDALIDLLDDEPDPVELVAFLTRRFAPPTLVNTEGDPLVICETTVRVGDPDRVAVALDGIYERADGEEPRRWHEHVTTQGMRRLRAVLVLDGVTIRVTTNSEKRMDDTLSVLARLDPTMEVIDDTREPVDAVGQLADQLPGGGALAPDDPQVVAAIDSLVRTYEVSWLDEPIPALAGLTPRQAADDPTRRGDLIRLLATFPSGAEARGGMDADRLRTALGL